jgi:Ca-activated chloride channel family protein
MRFANPQMLWLLAACPLFLGLLVLDLVRRRRTLAKLGHLPTLQKMVASSSPQRRFLKGLLLVLATGGVALALARPQYGGKSTLVKRRGIDVVIALDFSKSMLARDVRPSRLERAKLELGHLIDSLGGDRVAMVAFAGEVLRYPLTTDYAAAKLFWKDLTPQDMPVGGTAIGKAIKASLELLGAVKTKDDEATAADPSASPDGDADAGGAAPPAEPKDADATGRPKRARVIFLISDGEDTESEPLAAAEEAKKAGVKIYTLGLGSLSGDLIPETTESGQGVDYLRKPGGGYVTAKLDEGTLRKVAQATGGIYVRSTTDAFGTDAIRAELRKLTSTEEGGTLVRQYEEGFIFALPFVLLLLFIEPLISDRRIGFWASVKGLLQKLGLTSLVLAALAMPEVARADEPPRPSRFDLFRREVGEVKDGHVLLRAGKADDALKRYDQAAKIVGDPTALAGIALARGAALAAKGSKDEAREAFKRASASDDPAVRQRAFYNLGTLELGQKKYDDAIGALKRALRLRPQDKDARWNLELALREKDKEEEKKREEEKKKKEQEKQQQKDKKDQEKNDKKDDKKDQQQDQKKDEQKPDPKKQDEKKKDEPKKDPQKPEPQSKQPEQKPPEKKPGEQKKDPQKPEPQHGQNQKAPPPRPEKQRQMESVLDALEKDEKNLAKERAKVRAVRTRTRPPEKDW